METVNISPPARDRRLKGERHTVERTVLLRRDGHPGAVFREVVGVKGGKKENVGCKRDGRI